MNDFSKYKFRCSGLGNLLVDPRSKTEMLSATTKTYLKELWIKEIYGRERMVSTKYTQKGTTVESDTLELVKTVTGITYFKNKERLENDYVIGTPDAWKDDHIIDAKSSWDLWTFGGVDEEKAKKDYFGQLMGYMWLTDKKKAKLAYGLVNTPEDIISYEMYLLKVKGFVKDGDEESEAKGRINFIFDDIKPTERVKIYEYEFDGEIQEKLIERITLSRQYMNTLKI